MLFRSKDRAKNGASKRGGGGGWEERKFLVLVSFLARPKPRISFLGLSLLRNSTETLATQANKILTEPPPKKAKLFCCIRKAKLFYLLMLDMHYLQCFFLGLVLFVKLKAGHHHLLSTTLKCIQGSS